MKDNPDGLENYKMVEGRELAEGKARDLAPWVLDGADDGRQSL